MCVALYVGQAWKIQAMIESHTAEMQRRIKKQCKHHLCMCPAYSLSIFIWCLPLSNERLQSGPLYPFFLADLSSLSFPFATDSICHGGTLSLAVRWRWVLLWKDVEATLWTISSYYSFFFYQRFLIEINLQTEHHTDLYMAQWEKLWNHLGLNQCHRRTSMCLLASRRMVLHD